jgi:hypothetical protein
MNTPQTFDQGRHFNELHEDHKDWILELEFNKKEIPFFQQLLENFAKTQAYGPQKAFIEQFQNKLIAQNELNDILLHEVKESEAKLVNFIKTHEKNIEFITFSDHAAQRNKMALHRKFYTEMKQQFFQGISLK